MLRNIDEALSAFWGAAFFVALTILAGLVYSATLAAALASTAALALFFGLRHLSAAATDARFFADVRERKSRERSQIRQRHEEEIFVHRNTQRVLAARFDNGEVTASEFHEQYAKEDRIIATMREQQLSEMASV